MKINEICLISGTNYKEITKELLAACDLAGEIGDPNKKVGIKPNLVAPTDASYGATTHPEVVAGIIEYLQEHEITNLSILEGSWVGDRTSDEGHAEGNRHNSALQGSGYPSLLLRKGT